MLNNKSKATVWRGVNLNLIDRVKPYIIEISILFFYFIALFPGRPSYDAVLITDMMKNGESAATWSATYFRLLNQANKNFISISHA